ncbi:MAG: YkgJ family cysteine cluster protein [Chitinophagaceae bacterium]|nr:YkgJ family cysteine cluster protein [Chitinophagaceae bacterium]MBL0254405.1 YkgJ family cysteine cluster protein [Chitinophagaceae bacterium]
MNKETDLLKNWELKAKGRKKEYKRYLQKVDTKKDIKRLPALHNEAFSKIDCLDCAACCKNYSPRFKTPDIKRISKGLGLKEAVFIHTYLQIDSDGDYVLRTKPCPFLGNNNQCGIYEMRPSDCRQFPYTDVDVLLKRQQITLKNAEFCPAVYYVLERLLEK